MVKAWEKCIIGLLTACVLQACGGGGDDGGDDGPLVNTFNTVNVEAGEGGAVSPDNRRVAEGESAVFSVVPDAGYVIESVSGCGGTLNGDTYTTGPVTADCTVTAVFSNRGYVIRGSVSGLDGSLVLTLNVADRSEDLTLQADDPETARNFAFDTRAQQGEAYEVTVTSQPAGQTCGVQNGFGEIGAGGAPELMVTCVSSVATASLSGSIFPTASIDVDSDVNDLLAEFADNSQPSLAQPVHNRVTLNGFASEQPTNGSADFERFADSIDQDDFFRVTLQQGQLVQLQVVDYEGFDLSGEFQGDLDLYLWDSRNNLISVSDSITEFEQIVVPATGTYLVNVYAYSGISKYVLRMAPASTTQPLTGGQARPLDIVPNEMIVKFKRGAGSARSKPQAFQGLNLKHQQTNRATLAKIQTRLHKVGSASARKTSQALRALNPLGHAKAATLRDIKAMRAQPGVAYAEPNYIRRPLRTPNDPGYWYQWHYDAIKLPQAWELNTAQNDEGPIVAVIDTGIFLEHPDLADQITNGYDFISDPDNARDGDGIDANADDPGDRDVRGQSSWHGTHVAGTIAAATNNTNGVAGIAWGARIMPIRVLGADGGTSYDVIQGLRYAAGLENDSGRVPDQRADVANLSLGGPNGSLAEQEAYRQARATGMIIVAAAGNESTSAPSYPAAYEGVISVSATDYLNQLAPYSNYGDTIDLAAPGGNLAADNNGDGYPDGVLSTLVDDTSGTRMPSYVFYHGTSMASPHVAGVIALMKDAYPALSPQEFRSLLQSGLLTDDLGAGGRDDLYGYGLINALKAVEVARDLAAGEPPPEPPPRVVAMPVSVNLELRETATVTLSNEGGGEPVVTSIAVEDEWLSVVADEIDASGLGSYTLVADRAGLEDGHYDSAAVFTVNNTEQVRVQVFMQVGTPVAEAELPQMYVLLVDAESEEVVDVVAAEPDASVWHYLFNEVPVGRYYVIGGSDIDVDDVVCQSGEACGAYPTLNNQQPVQVQGTDIAGLEFVANILGGLPTTSSYLAAGSVGRSTGRQYSLSRSEPALAKKIATQAEEKP